MKRNGSLLILGLLFVSSCGRLSAQKILDYKKHLRCKHCEVTNESLVSSDKFNNITDREALELFEKVYSNGLLDFYEAASHA